MGMDQYIYIKHNRDKVLNDYNDQYINDYIYLRNKRDLHHWLTGFGKKAEDNDAIYTFNPRQATALLNSFLSEVVKVYTAAIKCSNRIKKYEESDERDVPLLTLKVYSAAKDLDEEINDVCENLWLIGELDEAEDFISKLAMLIQTMKSDDLLEYFASY